MLANGRPTNAEKEKTAVIGPAMARVAPRLIANRGICGVIIPNPVKFTILTSSNSVKLGFHNRASLSPTYKALLGMVQTLFI